MGSNEWEELRGSYGTDVCKKDELLTGVDLRTSGDFVEIRAGAERKTARRYSFFGAVYRWEGSGPF